MMVEMTIADLLEKQTDPSWRLLNVEDLDLWAKVHDWLLVEVKVYGEMNIIRHYLTPIGNELLFHLNDENKAKATVRYSGTR